MQQDHSGPPSPATLDRLMEVMVQVANGETWAAETAESSPKQGPTLCWFCKKPLTADTWCGWFIWRKNRWMPIDFHVDCTPKKQPRRFRKRDAQIPASRRTGNRPDLYPV